MMTKCYYFTPTNIAFEKTATAPSLTSSSQGIKCQHLILANDNSAQFWTI